MTRACAFHSLKTLYLILNAAFSDHAYWKSGVKEVCYESFFKVEILEQFQANDLPRYIFLTLLITAALLNILSWKCRRVSVCLFYLECLSFMLETVLFGHVVAHYTSQITFRFCVTVIFLSTEAISSIITATICTLISLCTSILVL